MTEIDVIIEIPKNTNIKYEFDHEKELLRVDRIINTPFVYPVHYGYLNNTLAEDGDNLDVLLLSDHSFMPGCIISCKVIGVLLMEDEKGLDHKIVTVPSDKIDKQSKGINNLSDINENYLEQIEYFFAHYKDLEKGKWSKVHGYTDVNNALDIVCKSQQMYKDKST
jgi:inorganic pyrophosphatase